MDGMTVSAALLAQDGLLDWIISGLLLSKVVIGFSIIIFFHELGHFLAAKAVGVRVDRFAIGFGTRLIGYRRGEGLTFGNRPNYKAQTIAERRYGETDYCLKALPLGGYVKMMGEDDLIFDEKTGDVRIGDDPRAYPNRPVWQRMVVVSAGVIFNIVLALVLFVWVFLAGKPVEAPVVGIVPPESPAFGKLRPGDRILEADGERIDSFVDLAPVAAFSDGTVSLKVQRDGVVLDNLIDVETTKLPREGINVLMIAPDFSTRVAEDGQAVDGKPPIKKGDQIRKINGAPVRSFYDAVLLAQGSDGETMELEVERPDPQRPDAPGATHTVYQRPTLVFQQSALAKQDVTDGSNEPNLLGMRLRRAIGAVEPGKPADRAGLKPGDVIVAAGGRPNPTYDEIVECIRMNAGQTVDLRVKRGSAELTVSVTPSRPFSMWGPPENPRIGVGFNARDIGDEPVVTDVIAGSPADALRMPRGSRLLSIDGAAVNDWHAVVRSLLAKAGRTVEVQFRSGDVERTGQMTVPSSFVNELNIRAGSIILSVDGQKEAELEIGGKTQKVGLAGNSAGIREYLRTQVGKTVTIRYLPGPNSQPVDATFAVRSDNIDPWQLRVVYGFESLSLAPRMEVIHANGDPLLAMNMGMRRVNNMILQVYQFISKLLTREMGFQGLSGPIGVATIGVETARQGWTDLVYFLAMLSINLAVINFLPLPVLDGGQMVFLLIERVRRKPLNFKTHMITTVVGLAAILLMFIVVTIQDITRFFGSS